MKSIKTLVALDLILCALGAYYMMAHVIFLQVFGRDVLPVGKAWVKKEAAAAAPLRAAVAAK